MRFAGFALSFAGAVVTAVACGGSDEGELLGGDGTGGGQGASAGSSTAGSSGQSTGGGNGDASAGTAGTTGSGGDGGAAASGGAGVGGEPGVGGAAAGGASAAGGSGGQAASGGASAAGGAVGGTGGTGGSPPGAGEIQCGNDVCSIPNGEYCCYRDNFVENPECRQLGDSCQGDLPILCDGPEDCQGGTACCGDTESVGFPFPMQQYVRVECKSPGDSDCDVIVCDPNGPNLCPSGDSCQDSGQLPQGYDVCR